MAFIWDVIASAYSNDLNVTTLALSKPPFIGEGDLLFTFLWSGDEGSQVVTTLAGWTLIESAPDNSSANTQINAYYKVAGDSEPDEYNWVQSVSRRFAGMAAHLLGADADDLIDDSTFGTDSGFDSNIVCPSVTATDDDAMLVTMSGTNTENSVTPPGGLLELFDTQADFVSTSGFGGAMGYETLTASGATGTRTWTRDSGNGRDEVIAFILNAEVGAGMTIEIDMEARQIRRIVI